ncbi:MAG: hypothetical protein NUW24_12955 [Anaerolineae bacterium]|jgi:hypothetical protein|nr:hypothetical protein [Anaerolineae bacterium]MDH7472393.1 hypothetical protein [Anaerolineae bacterium]
MDVLLAPFLTEQTGMLVAFVLTLLIFSYLLGDNPLFRLAQALLVGVGVGYGIVVVFHYVLIPRLALLTTNWLLVVPPLLLGLLLWAKLQPSWSRVGNVSVAFILGAGAALAIGGALLGTLAPQVRATLLSLNPADYPFATDSNPALDAGIIVAGTICVLLSFYFHAPAPGQRVGPGGALLHFAGRVGRYFIMITFGALFANMAMSLVSLLLGRVEFLMDTMSKLLVWLGFT